MASSATLMPLQALVNQSDSGLPIVHELLADQLHEAIRVASPEAGGHELVALQVSTRSPMGAIAYTYAAIFIQHGFIRVLGAGRHPRITRSVTSSSLGKFPAFETQSSGNGGTKVLRPGGLIIADDVLGGVFALSGGNVPGVELGHVGYYSPATQQFEDLGIGYSAFLGAMGSRDNFQSFYADALWPGWEDEVKALHGDQSLDFYPPLPCSVAKAGGAMDKNKKDDKHAEDESEEAGRPNLRISERSRKPVNISEAEPKWT